MKFSPHHLEKKLKNLEIRPSQGHQQKLKNQLMQKATKLYAETPAVIQESSQGSFWNSWWQRSLALAMMVFFVFLIIQFKPQAVKADAKTMLRTIIQDVTAISKKRGELLTDETRLTLDILNEALNANELRFIGKKMENGYELPVFVFDLPEFYQSVMITINPYQDNRFLQDKGKAVEWYSNLFIKVEFASTISRLQQQKVAEITLDRSILDHPEKIREYLTPIQMVSGIQTTSKLPAVMHNIILHHNLNLLTQAKFYLNDPRYGQAWCGRQTITFPAGTKAGISQRELLDVLEPVMRSSDFYFPVFPSCLIDEHGSIHQFSLTYASFDPEATRLTNETGRQELSHIQENFEKLIPVNESEQKYQEIILKLLKKAQNSKLFLFSHARISLQVEPIDRNQLSKVPALPLRQMNVIQTQTINDVCLMDNLSCGGLTILADPEAKSLSESIYFRPFLWDWDEKWQRTIRVHISKDQIERPEVFADDLQSLQGDDHLAAAALVKLGNNSQLRLLLSSVQDKKDFQAAQKLFSVLHPFFENTDVAMYEIVPTFSKEGDLTDLIIKARIMDKVIQGLW